MMFHIVLLFIFFFFFFFFSSRRRHTRSLCDWSSDVCSSDLYLPRACENGKDLEARSRMLAAASMGATAFQKGLGGVHAIAHPVGAHFNTHHGLTNAVVLPYITVHNRRAIEPHLPVIARTLNLPGEPFAAVFDWVLGFRKHLNIPHSLA